MIKVRSRVRRLAMVAAMGLSGCGTEPVAPPPTRTGHGQADQSPADGEGDAQAAESPEGTAENAQARNHGSDVCATSPAVDTDADADADALYLAGTTVTYQGSIQTLLATNCTGCHRPGATKPDLSTYQTAAAGGPRSLIRIQAGTMPPKGPLSSTDTANFQAWADGGYLEAAAAPVPAPAAPAAPALRSARARGSRGAAAGTGWRHATCDGELRHERPQIGLAWWQCQLTEEGQSCRQYGWWHRRPNREARVARKTRTCTRPRNHSARDWRHHGNDRVLPK